MSAVKSEVETQITTDMETQITTDVETQMTTDVEKVSAKSPQAISRYVRELKEGQTIQGNIPVPLTASKTKERIEEIDKYYKAGTYVSIVLAFGLQNFMPLS